MKRLLWLLPLVLSVCCACPLGAQELIVRGAANFHFDARKVQQISPTPAFATVDLKLGWRLAEDEEFARLYNGPHGGVGVSYSLLGRMEYPYGSRMGDGVSLYGFFMRPLVRSGWFQLGYLLELGGSYLASPYDQVSNPLNNFYSSSFLIYLAGSVYASAQLSPHWAIGVEAGARHNSSGCLAVPNRGLSSGMVAFDVKYTIAERKEPLHVEDSPTQIINKPFRWGFFAGGGVHQCMEEMYRDRQLYPDPQTRPREYTRWFKGSVGLEAFWRYGRRLATGLGAEFFYYSDAESLRQVDAVRHPGEQGQYSSFAVGLLLLQEVYYRHVAAHGGVGVYLDRRMGLSDNFGSFYQELGMRYYPERLNGFFVGFNVRLHYLTVSDYMEITIGKHF